MYLESQGILFNWWKLQSISQGVLSTITNIIVSTGQISSSVSTTSNSAPFILPTTTMMSNLGIPLTSSAAMGFAIGIMKG